MTADEDILFRVDGTLGRVHLNAPGTFNSLTREMCIAFRDQLASWRDDPDVAAVLVTAAGDRAFCAGGDIRRLYDIGRADPIGGRTFFWHEYRLDHAVHEFPKPYVALVDGIVMGGGVGVSVHGSHRIVTEKTIFAMPECGIGLFPDVGASEFLGKSPGALGMYLGLTGARLKAADAILAGFATHFVPSARLDELAAGLSVNVDAIDTYVAGFAEDPGTAPLDEHRHLIDRHFAADSVTGIISGLDAEDGYWAIETADELRDKSPISLRVTHRQLRDAHGLGFDELMRIEYRMACRFLEGVDFFEGIRAAVIDKDRKPKWAPARLDHVDDHMTAAYFAPVTPELDLD
jgi:enoyl-CoA hydratase